MDEILDGVVGGLIDLAAGAVEAGVELFADGTAATADAADATQGAPAPEALNGSAPGQDSDGAVNAAEAKAHGESYPQRGGSSDAFIDLIPGEWPTSGQTKPKQSQAQSTASAQFENTAPLM